MIVKVALLVALTSLSYQISLDSWYTKEANATDWWERAVFYQIYPRSFKDDDKDGTGDLKGITSKLEHLKDAGVTATWLSPIFKSPGVDQGYDISDYYTIDPLFGNKDDFQDLLKKAHDLGIKVILDFVPNHTSDEHEWFKNSIAKKDGYDDYYIWHDGIFNCTTNTTNPPNNWVSLFKGSAWTWNEKRQQFYLHQFASAQPDLNYRNPEVVEAMKDVLRNWLDVGVDGFRIDAVPFLFEDPDLTDEPLSNKEGYNSSDYEYLIHDYTMDLNETYDMIYQWRELADNYTDGDTKILMTEAYTSFNKTLLYYGTPDGETKGAHFTFNFFFITDLKNTSSADDIKDIIDNWLNNLPEMYTFNWVFGNHDNHRVATRLGPENVDAFNMLSSILPGVQVNYNGEEIGMEDGEVKCEEGQDPQTKDKCDIFDELSRDFERTPFQWDDSENAGFSEGNKTWLPVSQKKNETNVEAQSTEGIRSHLNTYKTLLKMRKDIPVSANTTVEVLNGTVLSITRETDDAVYQYLYNRLGEKVVVDLEKPINDAATLVVVASSLDSIYKPEDKIDDLKVTLDTADSVIIKKDLHPSAAASVKICISVLFIALSVFLFN